MVEKSITTTLLKTIDNSISSMEALVKGLEFVRPDKAGEAKGAVSVMKQWKEEIEKESNQPDLEENIWLLGV